MNVQTIIDQIDLVDYVERYTELTKQGDIYRGVCPICQHDNNTEFCVYDHRSYHCWACGSSGDVINFIKDRNKVDFYTALESLADELNVDITRDPKYQERKKIVSEHELRASECHRNVKVVEDYLLKKRALTKETIEYFQLGADEMGNVTIPLIDRNGRYVGMALRRFESEPKYLTNKNDDVFTKAEYLFNLRGAKEKLTNKLYMVEGFFCAMSLHQAGYAAVAYNSSQPTKQHLQKLQKLSKIFPELTVVLVPDNDKVAPALIPKVRKNILKYCPDVAFEVLTLPDGEKDVNDFFADGGTVEQFEKCEKSSLDSFALLIELSKCASISAEKKVTERFVKSVSDSLTLINISKVLAKRWDMEEKAIQDFLHVSQKDISLDDDFKAPEQCLAETKKMLEEKSVQYGITALDDGIRGAGRRKDTTFIGGYSSVGKTMLTVQMAVDMVARQHKNVVYFSMEMSAGALYERVIANLLKKPVEIVDEMILSGNMLVYNVLDKLKEHFLVVDKNGLDIKQVDAYIKDANAKFFDGQLEVVFIDYIQYMRDCSDYQVLAETAKGMKPLAKENDIHVVVISQLNRSSRIWEKPSMADLKGGGDLEASADNILLLWKPASNPDLMPEEAKLKKNEVMCAVGKARYGTKIEEVALEMDGECSRMRLAK